MVELYIHRPPMKTMLRAVTRMYSLYDAIDVVNKEWGTDYTERDVVKWGHIPAEEALKELQQLKQTTK